MVRQEFVSLSFNPVIRRRNPPLYLTELILYEVIEEFAVDSAVELCQEKYLPISRKLKTQTMLHHILEEMIHDVASEQLLERKAKKYSIELNAGLGRRRLSRNGRLWHQIIKFC